MRSYATSAALGLALALPATAVTVYSQVPMKAASTSAPVAASGTVVRSLSIYSHHFGA
jgi:hypothetical protein